MEKDRNKVMVEQEKGRVNKRWKREGNSGKKNKDRWKKLQEIMEEEVKGGSKKRWECMEEELKREQKINGQWFKKEVEEVD